MLAIVMFILFPPPPVVETCAFLPATSPCASRIQTHADLIEG